MRRALERAVLDSPAPQQAAGEVAAQANQVGAPLDRDRIRTSVQQALNLQTAVDRVGDAVGRGNRKVFAEIGREFARFLDEFLADNQPDYGRLEQFCTSLHPGDPPEGQRYLRQAFKRYYRSFFTDDPKSRSEMLLCANIEIGLHEQTRLQPEIAEALDSAYTNTSRITRRLVSLLFPFTGLMDMWVRWGRSVLRRPTALEQSIRILMTTMQLQMRRTFTDTLMTIHFPPDVLVRLGDDLASGFPENLQKLVDPDLCNLLERLDPTPNNLAQSGARDWANLSDRLHFIIDLFRCYQETPDIFDPPFTPAQTDGIKAGRMPGGRL